MCSHVLCFVCSHCVVECVDLVWGLKHTHQHINLHTFQCTHIQKYMFPTPNIKNHNNTQINTHKSKTSHTSHTMRERRKHVCEQLKWGMSKNNRKWREEGKWCVWRATPTQHTIKSQPPTHVLLLLSPPTTQHTSPILLLWIRSPNQQVFPV